MISIENLSKSYEGQQVLNIPKLHIPAGERFGLVGNNGAGKTTLFSLLLDLIQPSTGQVYSKGKPVAGSEHWKPYTGAYIDQQFLIDFLRPEEFFDFVGKMYGLQKEEIRQRSAGFEDLFQGEILGGKKFIRDLSKGNQKKVGIAAALIGDPELLILDEPFANLDPSAQIRLKEFINQLPAEVTMLISSHDLSHVTDVCQRIVALRSGEVARDLSRQEDALRELEAFFAE